MKNAFSFLCFLAICAGLFAQPTYAERLGFPAGARVLILHVDDAGMSWDSNEGALQALTQGVATSVSVMMPCPWTPGFVHALKENPGLDAGLHLTLTSEWADYRWGPLTGKPAAPGLTDAEGALWPSIEAVVQHASADEVDAEIRAQLARARAMGFEPTHLDSHMGTLFATPDFLMRYLQLGMETGIPVMFPAGNCKLVSRTNPMDLEPIRALGEQVWAAGLPVLDDLHNLSYGWEIAPAIAANPKKLQRATADHYMETLREVEPGLTMVIMHCTDPTEVFAHISDSGPTRQGDLLAMLDPRLRTFLSEEGFILTTWREVKERRIKAGN